MALTMLVIVFVACLLISLCLLIFPFLWTCITYIIGVLLTLGLMGRFTLLLYIKGLIKLWQPPLGFVISLLCTNLDIAVIMLPFFYFCILRFPLLLLIRNLILNLKTVGFLISLFLTQFVKLGNLLLDVMTILPGFQKKLSRVTTSLSLYLEINIYSI